MPAQKSILKTFLYVLLFLGLQVGIWGAYAATQPPPPAPPVLSLDPAVPEVETGEKLPLTLQGAQGAITWKAEKGKIEGRGAEVYYVAPPAPGGDSVTATDAAGHTLTVEVKVQGFLDLVMSNVLFLLMVGFVGGLVSGFIGSGGAFVLTPAMMSMGVPGIVAVASNICHKFPKALVGAMKRHKYGQVDVKLGLIMGLSAEAGVLVGAGVQEKIKAALGDAGSNLYVSVVFVVVLAIVGGYVMRDALKMYRSGSQDDEQVTKLARWVQSINIPGTMMYFPSLKASVSVLFTLPLGFATGMLAATIAVGGFIGVPSMIYILGAPSMMASATELVIAFVMGLGGSIKYAWGGFVDIRLAMIILAGSLFGIQLGAIGTTYVKPFMVKLVMGTIMMLVLLSRGLMVPVYLAKLGYISPMNSTTASVLSGTSFTLLIGALLTGGVIVLWALLKGRREHLAEEAALAVSGPRQSFSGPVAEEANEQTRAPYGRMNRILVASEGSEFSSNAVVQAVMLAARGGGRLHVMSVLASSPEHEALAAPLLKREKDNLLAHLEKVKEEAKSAGAECETLLRFGSSPYQELAEEAELARMDLIVMGRRGSGMFKTMVGSSTARVIGLTRANVLVVPRVAPLISGKRVVLATDGSRDADAAAAAAGAWAKRLGAPITVVSVVYEQHGASRRSEAEAAVQRTAELLRQQSLEVETAVVEGRAAEAIVAEAKRTGADLIVMGSRGRTGLERVLVGSVSERVIGLSECSVLVVKV